MEDAKGTAIGVGVLLGAAIGAALATFGEAAIAPTPVGLAALVAVVVAAAGWLTRPQPPPWATAALLVALGLVAAQDVFAPGVAHGHDLKAHAWATYATWRTALDGAPFPRWTPYVGFGMPLLQFYGPLPWMATWPAQALGATPLQALEIGLAGASVAAAASGYVAARWLGRSPAAGLVAAAALVFGPYRLLDQSFRMAYAELWALALLPLVLAAAVLVARGERAVGRLAAAGGALILTHPVSGLLLVPVSVLPLLLARRPGGPRAFAAAVAIALGVTAAWWVPMVAEQHHTTLDQTARMGRSMGRYAAYPEEALRRQAWERYDVRRKHRGDRAAERAAVPMYFGWGLLALTGLALATRLREDVAWGGAAVVGLALAYQPTAWALDAIPISGRIQFAWRFLSPATACAALAAAHAVDAWGVAPEDRPAARRPRAALAAVAVAVLAFDAVPSLGAPGRVPPPPDGLSHWTGARHVPLPASPADGLVRAARVALPPTSPELRAAVLGNWFPEYMTAPVRARFVTDRPDDRALAAAGVSWRKSRRLPSGPGPGAWLDGVPLDVPWEARGGRVEVTLPAAPPNPLEGTLSVAVQHFAGWRVRIGDGPWGPAAATGEGWLAADLPAGTTSVSFRYSAWLPLHRGAANVASIATVVVLLIRRRRRAPTSEPQ